MKKTILLALALTSLVTLKAQWVNNPVNNTALSPLPPTRGERH